VFECHDRARGPARAVAVAGAGLGLAIAQRVVALHGGLITVDSVPGEGTRFAFTLPQA
jgi:signal transduction histidine kinase